jgi:type VI secretion system protein ImpA
MGGFAGLVADSTYVALLYTPVVRGTKPGERSERIYTALDYVRAKDMEGLDNPAERERQLELGYVAMSEFRAIADLTAADFYADTLEAINSCLASCEELGEFFRANCRDDEYGEPTSPGLAGIRQQLETLQRIVAELSGKDASAMESKEEETESEASGSVASPKSQEMTRESAFQTIERVAQFFERTEPHSPVYFALRQVVRWGRMPFPDLLAELIADDSVMHSLRKQIGLPPEKYNE